MEKRSDRHIRDLVAHTAFKGLDANEIGCARISVMAGAIAPFKGPNTDAQDQPPPFFHIRLATHGRSIQMGQQRPRRPRNANSDLPLGTDIARPAQSVRVQCPTRLIRCSEFRNFRPPMRRVPQQSRSRCATSRSRSAWSEGPRHHSRVPFAWSPHRRRR